MIKYEISYIDKDGHEVTGQIFTAENVSGHLKNLEDWGCSKIVVKSLDDVKEENLNEGPDDDGIMTDDELDAQDKAERDEFEARLKARRDKVAQQRADRDAKIAKDNELKAKADELAKAIGDDWSFEHLFDVLVPQSGKCDSLAGELIRAANRLEYRWFNDGDRFNEDYGIETCGQPAYFLAMFEDDDDNPFWDVILDVDKDNNDDDAYDSFIENIKNKVVDYIKEHKELLAKETEDMYDTDLDDVESWLDENDLIPKYDTDAEIPPQLQAHIDAGNIDERDLIWEVQSWIENMGNSTNDVEIQWGNVYVYNLDKADYDELSGNLYDWLEDYASQLDDEYGDPNEVDDEEEEEETSEE